ncbi:MAG: response regulator transcription factor [Anaerolineae bacterium]
MPRTILVVDDEARLRALLEAYLKGRGYAVATAADGIEALQVAARVRPDLIVLDIMMPRMDGIDFLKSYRRSSGAPVIVLTARVEETDTVLGLELGADDYVTKPFSPRELEARIRAVLRRVEGPDREPEVLRAGAIVLDRDAHTVEVAGQLVDLTPSEFALLASLMSEPGRVHSRAALLAETQGEAYPGYERTIDVHISHLRSKIETDPNGPRYIETVYGVGYRFVETA